MRESEVKIYLNFCFKSFIDNHANVTYYSQIYMYIKYFVTEDKLFEFELTNQSQLSLELQPI